MDFVSLQCPAIRHATLLFLRQSSSDSLRAFLAHGNLACQARAKNCLEKRLLNVSKGNFSLHTTVLVFFAGFLRN